MHCYCGVLYYASESFDYCFFFLSSTFLVCPFFTKACLFTLSSYNRGSMTSTAHCLGNQPLTRLWNMSLAYNISGDQCPSDLDAVPSSLCLIQLPVEPVSLPPGDPVHHHHHYYHDYHHHHHDHHLTTAPGVSLIRGSSVQGGWQQTPQPWDKGNQ